MHVQINTLPDQFKSCYHFSVNYDKQFLNFVLKQEPSLPVNEKNMLKDNNDEYLKKANKISLVAWALINNNVVHEMLYIIFLGIDFIIQIGYVLSFYYQVGCFPANLETLASILNLGSLNNAPVLGIAFSTVLFLYIVMMSVFVLKKDNSEFFIKQRLWFKPIGILPVMARTFLFCIIFNILISNFHAVPEKVDKTLQLLALALSAVGLLSLLLIIYFSAFLLNLVVPNDLIPWAEVSPQPQLFQVIFKFWLVMAHQFRSSEPILFVMAALATVALAYQIIHRLYRGYMLNSRVFKVAIFLDMHILHFLLLLLISRIYSNPQYFYFTLILLPSTLFGTTRLIKITLHSQITCLERQKFRNKDSQLICYLHLLQLFHYQKHRESKEYLKMIENLHYCSCQDFLSSSLKLQEKERLLLVSEQSEVAHGNNQFTFADPKDVHLQGNTEEFKFELKSEGNEELSSPTIPNFSAIDDHTFDSNDQLGKRVNVPGKKKSSFHSNNLTDAFSSGKQENKSEAFQPEEVQFNQKDKSYRSVKKMLKHFFTFHLQSDQIKDFRLRLAKVYYIFKIANKSYLAHFALYDFIMSRKKESYFQTQQRLVNQRYIDEMIIDKEPSDGKSIQLDLKLLIDINKIKLKFEQLIETLSERILTFWQNISKLKEVESLFDKGILISQDIEKLQKQYQRMDEKQQEKDFNIYYKMAMFYKQVVFKENEFISEIMKYKNALQMKKLINMNVVREAQQVKGLLLAKLNLKRPMVIEFANKTAANLAGYSEDEIVGKIINDLMPTDVSKCHQKFIDDYLVTGKEKMINRRNAQFLKQKSGMVIPVYTYLFVNHYNRKNMILLLEYNDDFQPFDDTLVSVPTPFILATKDFKLQEVSKTFPSMLGISSEMIAHYESLTGRSLYADDLFSFVNRAEDNSDIAGQDLTEAEVVFRYDELMNNYEGCLHPKMKHINYFPELKKQVFLLKVITLYFQRGEHQLKVLAFQKQQTAQTANDQLFNHSKFNSNQSGVDISSYRLDYPSEKDGTYQQDLQEADDMFTSTDQQSSSISSSFTNVNRFQEYTNSINSNETPRTLKFILQLVIVMFLVMSITGVVTLALTLSNMEDAHRGFYVSDLTYRRLTDLSTSRILIRSLLNIANGYQSNSNFVLEDRTSYYFDIIDSSLEEMRVLTNELKDHPFPNIEVFQKVRAHTLLSNATESSEILGLDHGLNLFMSHGQSIVQSVKDQGLSYLQSNLSFVGPSSFKQNQASIAERSSFFIIKNSLSDIFIRVREYATSYMTWKIQGAEDNILYTTAMCFACIALIAVCGLAIIPLFGRVQGRVINLIQLFFNIDSSQIKTMLESISEFVDSLQRMKNKQRLCNEEENKTESIRTGQRKVKQKESNKSEEFKGKETAQQNKAKHWIESEESVNMEEEEEKEKVSEEIEEHHHQKKKHQDQKNHHKSQDSREIVHEGKTKFRKHYNKKKLTQGIFLATLAGLLTIYFFVMYALSSDSFQKMSESLNLLDEVYRRQTCVINVLYTAGEIYIFNESIIIQNRSNTYNLQDHYTSVCFESERTYNLEIRKAQPSYLGQANDFIQKIETKAYCDILYGENGSQQSQSLVECQTVLNGVFATGGMTAAIFYIYQTIEQIEVRFLSAGAAKTRDLDFLINGLETQISPLLDVVLTQMTKVQKMLQEIVLQELDIYFGNLVSNFVIIFVIFMAFQVAIILFFSLRVFKRIKRQMLLSNRLLYIIDFDNLTEVQRKKISMFVSRN